MACDADDVAVWVSEPQFAVVGCGVHERFQEDVSIQGAGLSDYCIKIFDFEPKHHAMTVRCCVAVDEIGMVVHVPSMELEDQLAFREQPLIHVAMWMFGQRVER